MTHCITDTSDIPTEPRTVARDLRRLCAEAAGHIDRLTETIFDLQSRMVQSQTRGEDPEFKLLSRMLREMAGVEERLRGWRDVWRRAREMLASVEAKLREVRRERVEAVVWGEDRIQAVPGLVPGPLSRLELAESGPGTSPGTDDCLDPNDRPTPSACHSRANAHNRTANAESDMIGMLTGKVLMSGIGEAILDCGGVGYLVACPSRTLAQLSEGETASLHIETHVREQSITLYGFLSDEERAWFVRLQTVQGVGAKAAMAILDVMTPGQILSAASLEDKTAFSAAQGVGPKLASRIAGELAGKAPPTGRSFGSVFTSPTDADASPEQRREGLADMQLRNDAVSALMNLGIGQPDALRAVSAAYKTFDADPDLDALIKVSLKEMNA